MQDKTQYIALLRGINVGGHHKVPMEQLRNEMAVLGFENVSTLLNSGNVIFSATSENDKELENTIANHLENVFGFPIPILIRKAESIQALLAHNPFEGIEVTKDIRLYVSFLKENPTAKLVIPWASEDTSFKILEIGDRAICSVLDIGITNTPQAMKVLEETYGKDITTRNWNTLNRIANKLN